MQNGTTTASYFATIHADSSVILGKIAVAAGQRAFIGKVNMNKNAPDFYCETTEDSIRDTYKFLLDCKAFDNGLVKPIITPRFAVSCDMDLLKELGKIADSQNLPIQTHISENQAEVGLVHLEFPDCKNYIDVYDNASLITEKVMFYHEIVSNS